MAKSIFDFGKNVSLDFGKATYSGTPGKKPSSGDAFVSNDPFLDVPGATSGGNNNEQLFGSAPDPKAGIAPNDNAKK